MQKQQVISHPLISVIIPIYNAASFLPQTIESVLSQDYPNLEILLLNDGSTNQSKFANHMPQNIKILKIKITQKVTVIFVSLISPIRESVTLVITDSVSFLVSIFVFLTPTTCSPPLLFPIFIILQPSIN